MQLPNEGKNQRNNALLRFEDDFDWKSYLITLAFIETDVESDDNMLYTAEKQLN